MAEAVEADAAGRDGALDRLCGDDASLRAEVEALLASLGEDLEFLEIPAAVPVSAVAGTAATVQLPPPYRPLERIAEGGMGEVWLAEREVPFRQRVAVKVLKRGMDSAEIVRRFEAERQILASLDHPGIARILDGGMTVDGRPYFVMEHVEEAESLTEHARRRRLTVAERVRLLRAVCEAVQAAHRSLIVHRDLKPSNVLVSGDGEVKLVDFGIAKLLDPAGGGGAVPPTVTRTPVLTPAYAAPEQLRGEPVSTATDVYALGVLLYELLVGRLPFEGATAMARVADDRDPTRPSTAARQTPDDEPALPLPPHQLARRLRGDLDTIVVKALQRDPGRRYASAEALAEDLEHHLRGQPIHARPDSFAYRSGKFVRRHGVAVGLAAVILLLLIGSSAVTMIQAQRLAERSVQLEQERDRAEEVIGVLIDLFETSNPGVTPGGEDMTVGEFLEQSEAVVLEELDDRPVVQARMKHVLAGVHGARSEWERSGRLLRDAYEQLRQATGERSPRTLVVYHDLAKHVHQVGELEEGREMLSRSLAMHRAVLGERHADVAQALQDLAMALPATDPRREEMLEEALAIRREVAPEDSVGLASNLNALAVHTRRSDPEGAERLYREALRICSEAFGDDHPKTLTVMNNLASLLSVPGRLDEAEALHRTLLERRIGAFGERSGAAANTWNNFGTFLAFRRDWSGAEEAFRRSLDTWIDIAGAGHPEVINSRRNLARVLQLDGRLDEAVDVMAVAASESEELHGVGAPQTQYLRCQHAGMLIETGRVGDAELEIAAALQFLAERAEERSTLAFCTVRRGMVRLAEDDLRGAAEAARSAPEVLRRHRPGGDSSILEAECLLGAALAREGRSDEAESLLSAALPGYRRWPLASAFVLREAGEALGEPAGKAP